MDTAKESTFYIASSLVQLSLSTFVPPPSPCLLDVSVTKRNPWKGSISRRFSLRFPVFLWTKRRWTRMATVFFVLCGSYGWGLVSQAETAHKISLFLCLIFLLLLSSTNEVWLSVYCSFFSIFLVSLRLSILLLLPIFLLLVDTCPFKLASLRLSVT